MTYRINENEINTIPGRILVIEGLLRILEKSKDDGDMKNSISCLREAIRSLDSLDDRLVKQIRKHKRTVVNADNFQERLKETRERFENVKEYINAAGGPDKFL